MTSFDAALSREMAQRLFAKRLRRHGIEAAHDEARFLVRHALGLMALDLSLRGSESIGAAGAQALGQALARRLAGEPVARILGAWEFWGLPFALSPGTLVPRPDTEIVVETALSLVGTRTRPIRLLDLGTGSGCLLVALLSELPNARGIGSDRSGDALGIARGNAVSNGVGARAGFVMADWCAPFQGPFDLIVSNPPYIASATIPGLAPEVREHDPLAALDGGPDGLTAYRAIIDAVVATPGLLAEDGALVLEIGFDQAQAVLRLGAEAGFMQRGLAEDLAGSDRVVTLRPPFDATSHTTKVDR